MTLPSIVSTTLRSRGFQILVTALQEDTVDLFELDLTVPTAIVFGNEQRGASEDVIALADKTVAIPMMGMVESLNISVACAVSLFEALRQRSVAGMYRSPQLSPTDIERRTAEWLTR